MLKHGLYEHLINTNSALNVISCFQLFTFLYPRNPGKCTLPMQHKKEQFILISQEETNQKFR